MPQPSTLLLRPNQHPQRPYRDIVIDNCPLATHLQRKGQPTIELVSPFGWPGEAGLRLEREAAARLLCLASADFPGGRYALLVCPICADLACGTVSLVIERTGDLIVWRDFAFETPGESETRDHHAFAHLHHFTFDAHTYAALFQPFVADR